MANSDVQLLISGGNVNIEVAQKLAGAASATVENTDQSYQDSVSPGGTLVIPDITITKNDDTTTTSPAAIDLDLGIIDPCNIPATWAELVAEYGQGYPYVTPTGQTTSFRTGDDANIESTIFSAARDANKLKVFNTLASFLVMENNNAFGNTNRFTDDAGGQTYANNLVIDHYTGLMWHRVTSGSANWNTQIDNALASTQGGHSDWFVPNREQVHSLINNESSAMLNYSPINHNANVCTSTTVTGATTNFFRFSNPNDTTISRSKANSEPLLLCRKHY